MHGFVLPHFLPGFHIPFTSVASGTSPIDHGRVEAPLNLTHQNSVWVHRSNSPFVYFYQVPSRSREHVRKPFFSSNPRSWPLFQAPESQKSACGALSKPAIRVRFFWGSTNRVASKVSFLWTWLLCVFLTCLIEIFLAAALRSKFEFSSSRVASAVSFSISAAQNTFKIIVCGWFITQGVNNLWCLYHRQDNLSPTEHCCTLNFIFVLRYSATQENNLDTLRFKNAYLCLSHSQHSTDSLSVLELAINTGPSKTGWFRNMHSDLCRYTWNE